MRVNRSDAALGGVAVFAVVAVVLGHVGRERFSGGGLGVDVILVLAGYIVTAALLNQIDRTGRVSLAAFYRCAWRVLGPALVVVVVVVAVGGLIVGADAPIGEVSAALVGASNWYSAIVGAPVGLDSGSLLQHLWVVALIAQVVVVWPFVLVACARSGGSARIRRVAGMLALASATLMVVLGLQWGAPGSEATARVAFGTDTRLTGVMLGAALATLRVPDRVIPPPQPVQRLWDVIAALSVGGLIMVFVVVPEFSAAAFRGVASVASMLGVALVAAVIVPWSRLGRAVIGAPLVMWLGARAYALYVWHWPVLVVADGFPPSGVLGASLAVAAMVVLADITHRYVERPIRDGAVGRLIQRLRWEDSATAAMLRRRMVVVVSAAGIVVAIAVAGMVMTPSTVQSDTATPADPVVDDAAESEPAAREDAESEPVARADDEGEPGPPSVVIQAEPLVDCAMTECVALTFDDGPGAHTDRLLDMLDDLDVTATFFMLGIQAESLPDVVRRAHEAGHEIGSHTYDHDNLLTLGASAAYEEIRAGNAAIAEIIGTAPTLFRPPYGATNATIRELAGDLGLTEILWDADTLDWRDRSASVVTDRAFDKVTAGSIVLLHDIHSTTVDAVPSIVTGLRAAGYTLVTVGTLLNDQLEPGATFTAYPRAEETPPTPRSAPSPPTPR